MGGGGGYETHTAPPPPVSKHLASHILDFSNMEGAVCGCKGAVCLSKGEEAVCSCKVGSMWLLGVAVRGF